MKVNLLDKASQLMEVVICPDDRPLPEVLMFGSRAFIPTGRSPYEYRHATTWQAHTEAELKAAKP